MSLRTSAFAAAGVLLAVALSGCAPWNLVTRPVPAHDSVMATDADIAALPPGDSPYIESNGTSGPRYGCSFIEFDGKGGFLDYNQYSHAVNILRQRSQKSNVLLVIYCHGWNNNAQSGDVIAFNSFLRRVAAANPALRVEGAFLSWRGSQYLQSVSEANETSDPSLHADFANRDLTNHQRGVPPLIGDALLLPELGSYFSIKDRAELQISRVELARAVFGLAYTVKSPAAPAGGNHVFVIGHSFGALALEQTLGQASVGLLSAQWAGYPGNAWPFDLIVFLNSAAPSLYAKQLQDFFLNDTKTTRKPRIVSITSTGDWATGTMHHLGNLPNRYFSPDLQRVYHPASTNHRNYTAGYYYDHTPGHNNLLINGCIDMDDHLLPPAGLATDQIFDRNLASAGDTGTFFAQDSYDTSKILGFRFYSAVRDYHTGAITYYPGTSRMQSNYWIITVPKEIIQWHTDVWTDSSMEMLAGVYSMVEKMPATPVAYPQAQQN